MLICLMFLQAIEILKVKTLIMWAVYFRGFIIVLDYDGTMVRFYYGITKKMKALLPCLDKDVQKYCLNNNLYENVYSFKVIKYLLMFIPKSKIYVLTRSEKSVMKHKTEAAVEYFKLKPEHILHVQDSAEKTEVLKKLLGESEDLNFRKYIYSDTLPDDAVVDLSPNEEYKNESWFFKILFFILKFLFSVKNIRRILFFEDSHKAALDAEETLRGKVYAYLVSSLLV